MNLIIPTEKMSQNSTHSIMILTLAGKFYQFSNLESILNLGNHGSSFSLNNFLVKNNLKLATMKLNI